MNRSIKGPLVILIGFLLAIYATIEITSDPGRGIVKTIRVVALLFIPVAFSQPKIGLYGVFIVLANIEWLKRYAIYYGDTSIWSVAETLVVPLILFSAVILGVLVGSFIGVTRMTKGRFLWFCVAALVIIFLLAIKGFSPLGIQLALNSGLYIAMVPVCLMVFKSRDEMIKFLDFTAIIFAPWAIVAIYQFYYGYSDVDWVYARTGISPVFTKTMLAEGGSRPFGLAGSASSFGAMTFLAWYVVWKCFYVKDKRFISIALMLIYMTALVLSSYRTALLSPIIALIGFPLFKSRRGLAVAYTFGLSAILAMFIFSEKILDNLGSYNDAIASTQSTEWGKDTLKVSTWSDRLLGYSRLKNPEAWSLFGKRLSDDQSDTSYQSKDFSHDMVNAALKNIGAVGLLVVIILGVLLLTILHRQVLDLPPGSAQNFGAMGLSFSMLQLAMSVIGGGNFNVPPTATFTWMLFATVVVAGRDARETRAYDRKRMLLERESKMNEELLEEDRSFGTLAEAP